MRGLRGEAGVFDLIRRRHLASLREGLVRPILDRGPIPLVAGVHICPEQARVYLLHQVIVVRPRFYPIRITLRALDLPINRNLHSSDQLPHINLHLLILIGHPLDDARAHIRPWHASNEYGAPKPGPWNSPAPMLMTWAGQGSFCKLAPVSR